MDTYVLTAGTQSQNTIKSSYFETSLRRCGKINWIHHERNKLDNSRDICSEKDLREFMSWKFSCAQHTCSTLPEDSTIVFSDIDIVWRSSAIRELCTFAKRGVYAMRKNNQGCLSAALLVSQNTPAFQWLLYRCHNYLKHHSRCNSDDALKEVAKESVKRLPVYFANSNTQMLTPISQVQCFKPIFGNAVESKRSIEQKSQMLRKWFDFTMPLTPAEYPPA